MRYIEEKILKVLKSKIPVTLFLGKENFLKEEVLRKIKEKSKDASFNWKVVNGEEFDVHESFTYISSYSFFPSRKFLIIKNGEKISSSQLNRIKEFPNQGNSKIIVTIDGKNSEKWVKIFHNVNKVMFFPLKDWEIKSWVREKIKEEKKEIMEQALSLLIEKNKGNLYSLNNEIEKLLSYSFDKERITLKEIEEVSSEGKEISVSHLIIFLLLKEIPKVFTEWESLRLSGVSPFSFIGLFTWELKRIGNFKKDLEEEKNFYILFKKYNIWDRKLQMAYQKVSREWSWKKIEKVYSLLQEIDTKLKNGYPPSPTFEVFFYKLVNS